MIVTVIILLQRKEKEDGKCGKRISKKLWIVFTTEDSNGLREISLNAFFCFLLNEIDKQDSNKKQHCKIDDQTKTKQT